MFGYVRVFKDELKVKEYELFKAHYCGLCKTLKKDFGFASRFALSYDLTFLSLLISSLSDNEENVELKSCVANPFKKKPVISPTSSLKYAACANVILTYFKLKDDISDNHSLKSAFALLFMMSAKRKAKKRAPELFEEIEKSMKRLIGLEKSRCAEPDKLSHEFSHLTECIFSFSIENDEKTRRILARMGYLIGRFIYLADAIDDYEKDKKKGSFNVLLESGCSISKEELSDSLEFTLSEISSAYNLLEIKKNKSILDNIIYLGLSDSLKKVGNPQKNEKETKHNDRPI